MILPLAVFNVLCLYSDLTGESLSLCEDYCTGGATFIMQRDDKESTAPSKLLLLFVQVCRFQMHLVLYKLLMR
jgi:hypothetical protein